MHESPSNKLLVKIIKITLVIAVQQYANKGLSRSGNGCDAYRLTIRPYYAPHLLSISFAAIKFIFVRRKKRLIEMVQINFPAVTEQTSLKNITLSHSLSTVLITFFKLYRF